MKINELAVMMTVKLTKNIAKIIDNRMRKDEKVESTLGDLTLQSGYEFYFFFWQKPQAH